MKRITLSLALLIAAPSLHAQARDIPSAQPTPPAGSTPEQRGRKLLDEMLEDLGGDVWLNRKNMREEGHVARFFRGAPTGIVIDFHAIHQFATANNPMPSASASSPTRA